MKQLLLVIISLFTFTFLNASCKKECSKQKCPSKPSTCVQELSCGCILIKQSCCSECSIDDCDNECITPSKCKGSCRNLCSPSSSDCCNTCRSCIPNNFNNRSLGCGNGCCNTCNSCLQNNFNCRCFDRGRVSDNWEWPHSDWP